MIKVGYSTCATKSNRKLVRRVNRQSSCIHVRAQVAVTLHRNKFVERFHELMLRLERHADSMYQNVNVEDASPPSPMTDR